MSDDMFKAFTEFLEAECVHETVYEDSEGRTILVIGLLDAFTMANRWGLRMVKAERDRLVKAERDRCCRIVYGMAGSDNVAQRTVEAIRGET